MAGPVQATDQSPCGLGQAEEAFTFHGVGDTVNFPPTGNLRSRRHFRLAPWSGTRIQCSPGRTVPIAHSQSSCARLEMLITNMRRVSRRTRMGRDRAAANPLRRLNTAAQGSSRMAGRAMRALSGASVRSRQIHHRGSSMNDLRVHDMFAVEPMEDMPRPGYARTAACSS